LAEISKIDLHTHTVQGSDCSVMTAEELIDRAALVGLDGVCITEHDTIRRSPELEERARERRLLLFYGVEANTDHGEVLAFGPVEYTEGFHELSQLRQAVDDTGGAIIAAHPFRREFSPFYSGGGVTRPTLEEACARPIMEMVDSLEVINGASTEEESAFGKQVAENINLAMAGGSDAHSADGVGICVTVFERRITTWAEFLEELRTGRYHPADLRSILPPGR
jgi:predicted metal-dependent phosphoesterase TrpH